VNWFDIVPEKVARQQLVWERNQSIFRASTVGGLTFCEIGKKYGISHTRAQQVTRIISRARAMKFNLSPVERYCKVHHREMEALKMYGDAKKFRYENIKNALEASKEKTRRLEILLKHYED